MCLALEKAMRAGSTDSVALVLNLWVERGFSVEHIPDSVVEWCQKLDLFKLGRLHSVLEHEEVIAYLKLNEHTQLIN